MNHLFFIIATMFDETSVVLQTQKVIIFLDYYCENSLSCNKNKSYFYIKKILRKTKK